jgi:hypothetical protein
MAKKLIAFICLLSLMGLMIQSVMSAPVTVVIQVTENMNIVPNADVVAKLNGSPIFSEKTDNSGKCDFYLDDKNIYEICAHKSGKSNCISLNPTSINQMPIPIDIGGDDNEPSWASLDYQIC